LPDLIAKIYLFNWKIISLFRLKGNKEAISEFKNGWEDGKVLDIFATKKLSWKTIVKMTFYLRPPII
jgi:hypothetical protein